MVDATSSRAEPDRNPGKRGAADGPSPPKPKKSSKTLKPTQPRAPTASVGTKFNTSSQKVNAVDALMASPETTTKHRPATTPKGNKSPGLFVSPGSNAEGDRYVPSPYSWNDDDLPMIDVPSAEKENDPKVPKQVAAIPTASPPKAKKKKKTSTSTHPGKRPEKSKLSNTTEVTGTPTPALDATEKTSTGAQPQNNNAQRKSTNTQPMAQPSDAMAMEIDTTPVASKPADSKLIHTPIVTQKNMGESDDAKELREILAKQAEASEAKAMKKTRDARKAVTIKGKEISEEFDAKKQKVDDEASATKKKLDKDKVEMLTNIMAQHNEDVEKIREQARREIQDFKVDLER